AEIEEQALVVMGYLLQMAAPGFGEPLTEDGDLLEDGKGCRKHQRGRRYRNEGDCEAADLGDRARVAGRAQRQTATGQRADDFTHAAHRLEFLAAPQSAVKVFDRRTRSNDVPTLLQPTDTAKAELAGGVSGSNAQRAKRGQERLFGLAHDCGQTARGASRPR